MNSRRRSRALICALLALSSACTTIQPLAAPEIADLGETFSHATFDAVLHSYVDMSGRVDYPALLANRTDLDRYYASLTAASPDSHPRLFRDNPERFPGRRIPHGSMRSCT